MNQHGLGQIDSRDKLGIGGGPSIGLEMVPVGPPGKLEKIPVVDGLGQKLGFGQDGLEMDPVANVVGQKLGMGQDGLQADEENRFKDPVMCEVNFVLNTSHTCSGPKVGREVGLGSQVDQHIFGLPGVIDVPSHVDSHSADKLSSDLEGDSDESASKFERNFRELMLGFQSSSQSGHRDRPMGSRRSERQKKPTSRFNEEVGFIPERPRSTKKKILQEGSSKGIISKPLLL